MISYEFGFDYEHEHRRCATEHEDDSPDRPAPLKWENGTGGRLRNIVERLIGWLKENRRICSRFEKTAKNFGEFLKMAFIHRYLRLATN